MGKRPQWTGQKFFGARMGILGSFEFALAGETLTRENIAQRIVDRFGSKSPFHPTAGYLGADGTGQHRLNIFVGLESNRHSLHIFQSSIGFCLTVLNCLSTTFFQKGLEMSYKYAKRL
jgi:hypothetical protein